MSDEILRQALFPFQHQAQLANAVTGFATCFGGIMPLLFCWLYRPQPRRWMAVYLCIFITGIFTVWLHAYEGNRLCSFFDVGTNILLVWALEIAVSGDSMGKAPRRRLLILLTAINIGVWTYLAYEVVAPVKIYVITFGRHGGFHFGQVALILNAFVVLGLFISGYKHMPPKARGLFHLVACMFLAGLFLATARQSLVSNRVFAWHAEWHLVGAFGFITLWFFNHVRFNEIGKEPQPADAAPELEHER
jgi:hypothetical protein